MRICVFSVIVFCLVAARFATAQSITDKQQAAASALRSQRPQQGKDCPDATTTLAINECMADVENAASGDFARFYTNLRSLLQSPDAQRLDTSQAQWTQYAQTACEAIRALYEGGTIAPSAMMRCKVRLTRSRMKDLDALYHTVLHH